MPTAYQRAGARRDLVEHFVYLTDNVGLDTAERFLANAEASFNDLAEQPMMGAPLTLQHPALANMRKWRIKDFDNYLIFYLPHPDSVSIIRVLHAARDWWSLDVAGHGVRAHSASCETPDTRDGLRCERLQQRFLKPSTARRGDGIRLA